MSISLPIEWPRDPRRLILKDSPFEIRAIGEKWYVVDNRIHRVVSDDVSIDDAKRIAENLEVERQTKRKERHG